MKPNTTQAYVDRRRQALSLGQSGLGNPGVTRRRSLLLAKALLAGGPEAERARRIWRKLSHWGAP